MHVLFYLLFFITPLLFFSKTSELFEFNKIILVYLLTTSITAVWIVKMIRERKIIFRRTLLDIPLLVFLFSQFLSTVFSIDFRTSLLGYYSRFNGGLVSTICYTLLYFAFVSNITKEKVMKSIYFLMSSSILVSLIAIFEHFDINITCALMKQGFESCWVQDVKNRVFSTFGQPNWLATWLVGLIPLILYLWVQNKRFKKIAFLSISMFLFTAILFTKSRSGLLGFLTMDILFWLFAFKLRGKKVLPILIVSNLLFIFLFLFVNNPWNPAKVVNEGKIQGPALETGGTESGTIRKIVWKGALRIWGHYPIFGSGVETFAYSYYAFRPVEHNLVSEWDFLYNKAHNEYLNIAATTGTTGILSYLFLIFAIYKLFIKNADLFSISLMAGVSGILVANFFGFSTVCSQIILFLFPAFATNWKHKQETVTNIKKINIFTKQKYLIVFTIFVFFGVTYFLVRYFLADTKFALGKTYNEQGDYLKGQQYLQKAIDFSRKEAVFHSEIANSYAGIALSLNKLKGKEDTQPFVELAISESLKATTLSPANVNILRNRAGVFLKLSDIDPKYSGFAKETLIFASEKAPTDAKILYNLALTYVRTGEIDKSINLVEKVVDIKPNYKDARYLYAILLIDAGNTTEARNQINYILENIDPKDQNSQNLLKKI